jgi:hypothetical protein
VSVDSNADAALLLLNPLSVGGDGIEPVADDEADLPQGARTEIHDARRPAAADRPAPRANVGTEAEHSAVRIEENDVDRRL